MTGLRRDPHRHHMILFRRTRKARGAGLARNGAPGGTFCRSADKVDFPASVQGGPSLRSAPQQGSSEAPSTPGLALGALRSRRRLVLVFAPRAGAEGVRDAEGYPERRARALAERDVAALFVVGDTVTAEQGADLGRERHSARALRCPQQRLPRHSGRQGWRRQAEVQQAASGRNVDRHDRRAALAPAREAPPRGSRPAAARRQKFLERQGSLRK